MGTATPKEVLRDFYGRTRPFGLWGRFLSALPKEEQLRTKAEHRRDVLGVLSALVGQVSLLFLPMQLMIGRVADFAWTAALAVASGASLHCFWLRPFRRANRRGAPDATPQASKL